jgi:pimeloyl-ACP methyl ester carboxylesterase
MYSILRPSRSEFVPIRSHRYHLRHWGTRQPGQPVTLLLHGWMDVSASWQFMVDALAHTTLGQRHLVAPDWRGFGQTRELHTPPGDPAHYGHTDHYGSPDYLADLDQLVALLNTRAGLDPDAPIDLVGHSMGGNVAMLYAGIRPQRIRRLVNLEGFGLPATRPSQAPGRLAQWLDAVASLRSGALTLNTYESVDGVARRLMKTNPRLPADKAQWLAHQWSAPNAEGRWVVLGDPAHKVIHAQLYRWDEVQEIWRRITAPVLAVEADSNGLSQWFKPSDYSMDEYHHRLQAVAHCQIEVVSDAGHMVHHDQPDVLARLIDQFLSSD